MKWVFLLLVLGGCTQLETIFVPTPVDVPVPVSCKIPDIAEPPDLISFLPKNASLTDGTKAFLAQHEYDAGYILQLKASLQACQ